MSVSASKASQEQWSMFCDTLKQSGLAILQSSETQDEVTQAEGLRYLTRILRAGIERFVENWDPLDPYMAPTYNDRLKWGMDNPDSIYSISRVDGDYEYELTGNKGTVPYFNLTSAKMGTDARQVTTGFLDGADIVCDPEGNFTIQIGGEQRSGNWLRLEPESNTVMLRETFAVRAEETPVRCRIRLVSPADRGRPVTIAQALDRTSKAQGFFSNTGQTFMGLTQLMLNGVNKLPAVDQALMDAMGGDPNYAYFWSAFAVEPGEALLLHLPYVPECDNWGLCLYNYWLESLDYTQARINLNKFTAAPNADGSITIVISDEQPEGGNWLSTLGHTRGNMMFRWTRAKEIVAPQAELVRLDSIDWSEKLRRWAQ